MRYQFFTIPAYIPDKAQNELNTFCAGHRIATIEKQFVANKDRSFWAICVSYLEKNDTIALPRKSKLDYREILDERDFAVFAKLRSLRKTMSDQEGIPAYALFTNEQLAAMVRGRITTQAGLETIDGVGKTRIDKYGKEFCAILKNEFNNKK
jgi:superfamily II DNA helicase RecQ